MGVFFIVELKYKEFLNSSVLLKKDYLFEELLSVITISSDSKKSLTCKTESKCYNQQTAINVYAITLCSWLTHFCFERHF